MVRDHVPLKQGLRHFYTVALEKVFDLVRDHVPLKQGLRPNNTEFCIISHHVRDHVPLKQGLRLFLHTL